MAQTSQRVCGVICGVLEGVHIHIANFLWSCGVRKLVLNPKAPFQLSSFVLEFQDGFCVFVNGGDSCSHAASEGSPCKAINKKPQNYQKLAGHFCIQVLQFYF